MLNLLKSLLPDPDATARRQLEQMTSEASRTRMIRQAGLEAVRKELEK